MFDIFFRPREANFSPKFRRTRKDTAEQTASRVILLGSFLKYAEGLIEYRVWKW